MGGAFRVMLLCAAGTATSSSVLLSCRHRHFTLIIVCCGMGWGGTRVMMIMMMMMMLMMSAQARERVGARASEVWVYKRVLVRAGGQDRLRRLLFRPLSWITVGCHECLKKF